MIKRCYFCGHEGDDIEFDHNTEHFYVKSV